MHISHFGITKSGIASWHERVSGESKIPYTVGSRFGSARTSKELFSVSVEYLL